MKRIQAALTVLLAALLLTGCGEEAVKNVEIDAVSKGWRPPLRDAEAITALRQEAAEAGKVLVIDCWATWCPPCVALFPQLHQALKERDDVMLVSLSFDEGEDLLLDAAEFLAKHKALDNAYQAAEGADAKALIAQALSPNWDGGALPAIFVYAPDGTLAYEMLQTRGGVQDWVSQITDAVDNLTQDAQNPVGQ